MKFKERKIFFNMWNLAWDQYINMFWSSCPCLPGQPHHVIHRLPGVFDPPQAPRLLLAQVFHNKLLEWKYYTIQNSIYSLIFITSYWNLLKYCKDSSVFSRHRPSGPMLSISDLSVYLSVCLSVCSLLRYRLNVFLPPLPEVGCPVFLEIRNPWGKVMERSGPTFEHFFWKWSKIAAQKKVFFFCWFWFTKHGGNHASRWIRDLWSKGVSLILAYL